MILSTIDQYQIKKKKKKQHLVVFKIIVCIYTNSTVFYIHPT